MFEVTRIVVPTDFSECSERALGTALELAQAFGATVQLVHVLPPLPHVAPPLIAGPVMIGQLRDEAFKTLEAYRVRVSRERGVDLPATLLEGAPHAAVVRFAQEQHASLVVMGTHGRSGIEHLLVGSVAERVLRTSPIPVLTVP